MGNRVAALRAEADNNINPYFDAMVTLTEKIVGIFILSAHLAPVAALGVAEIIDLIVKLVKYLRQ